MCILELPGNADVLTSTCIPASKYRGAAPIQQAVIDGEKESGVTIMRMGTGLDTGDMISRIVVPIAKDETGGTLFDRLAEAGVKLLVETLPHIFDGTAVYEKQPEESPTPYAGMITKQMGLINLGKSAGGTGKTGARFKSVAKCIYFLEWKNFEGMGKLCSKK